MTMVQSIRNISWLVILSSSLIIICCITLPVEAFSSSQRLKDTCSVDYHNSLCSSAFRTPRVRNLKASFCISKNGVFSLNIISLSSTTSHRMAESEEEGDGNVDWNWEEVADSVFDGEDKRPIILFDGVCNLCNGGVNYALDHDEEGKCFTFYDLFYFKVSKLLFFTSELTLQPLVHHFRKLSFCFSSV